MPAGHYARSYHIGAPFLVKLLFAAASESTVPAAKRCLSSLDRVRASVSTVFPLTATVLELDPNRLRRSHESEGKEAKEVAERSQRYRIPRDSNISLRKPIKLFQIIDYADFFKTKLFILLKIKNVFLEKAYSVCVFYRIFFQICLCLLTLFVVLVTASEEPMSTVSSAAKVPVTQSNTIQKLMKILEKYGLEEQRGLKRVYLRNRTITCNDGSHAGFYLRKSHGSKRWIIFLEGGWYCYDEKSCRNRWLKLRHLMTSTQWPETRDGEGKLSYNVLYYSRCLF